MKPLISVIIPTYNRVKTIGRTIESILAQTYDQFEIIVVDDGSTDDTMQLLSEFNDPRIRIVKHEVNKGVTAAKNTGLNNIRGEWFTILDSDDEIIPEALELMMNVPLLQDEKVNAVSCNCIDTSTGKLSGTGLEGDGYLDIQTLVNKCNGEFWGLTKTSLLQDDRFNERLGGYESTLWMKINERANRFYVHKGLRIYHTEGDDRILKAAPSIQKISTHYQVLSEEKKYLEILKKYLPGFFAKDCLRANLYLSADNKKEYVKIYHRLLNNVEGYRLHKMISFFFYHTNAYFIKKGLNFLTMVKIIR